MKNLKLIFILLIVSCIVFSCDKAKTTPGVLSPTPSTEKNNSVISSEQTNLRAPLIIAISNTIKDPRPAKLTTVFDQTTANFFGSSLYMHWSTTSSTGPWTNGVLPFNSNNPTYLYNFGSSFASGTTVYLFYSTSAGTSYPSGSASPVYSVLIP